MTGHGPCHIPSGACGSPQSRETCLRGRQNRLLKSDRRPLFTSCRAHIPQILAVFCEALDVVGRFG